MEKKNPVIYVIQIIRTQRHSIVFQKDNTPPPVARVMTAEYQCFGMTLFKQRGLKEAPLSGIHQCKCGGHTEYLYCEL